MDNLEKARLVKEKGNELFRKKDYRQALSRYTEAIPLCPDASPDQLVCLRNRAACHLKLDDFDKAIEDCVAVLRTRPDDIKALYRYAQALDGRGKTRECLVELKKLLKIDPKNKEAIEMARQVETRVRQMMEKYQLTDTVTEEMFSVLSSKDKASAEEQVQAAKNLAILSRQAGGVEKLFRYGMPKLLSLLELNLPAEATNHIIQTFVGICINSKSRSHSILQTLSLERVSDFLKSSNVSISISTVLLLKEIVLALTGEGEEKEMKSNTSVVPTAQSLVVPIVQLIYICLASPRISADTRDGLLELFAKTVDERDVARLYLEEGLVTQLLKLSAHTGIYNEGEEEGEELEGYLPVSENCRLNVAMVLSTLYNKVRTGSAHKDLRELFKKHCMEFVVGCVHSQDIDDQGCGLTALATVLQGVVEIGNDIFQDEHILSKTIELTTSEQFSCKVIATEALTLAASDKSRCQGIMQKGLPALKELYHSSDECIRVRALVGLCKLGSSGGGNVNAQPFAEGATLKLFKSCCKFLIGARKGGNLRKFAAEGIAFLSLDAEVKESLIVNERVLQALFKLVESPDKSLLYGVASIFVNLTNSYDKPERNPELEELGKYAGENIPKEHEYDGAEFVAKRVSALLKAGIVQSLNSLSVCEGKGLHEQVSRVFLALTNEVDKRGVVIQQGGVKSLLTLSLNNTEKGSLIAAQALAKIGITNNPTLAFPGQRCQEVVRPLVCLLKSESGLQQFEGLMALTNLAGMGQEVCQRIYREGAVPTMEGLMFEENELIRCAATEALCNLIQLPEVHKRFYGDDLERVKLWTLFSGEDDERLARAASGGVAQLSHDPAICKQIMSVKSWKEIMLQLVASDNTELQHRGMYILANLVEASKDIAEEIVENEFLEIFMAYAQGEKYASNVQDQAKRALKKAEDYGLIVPNPNR